MPKKRSKAPFVITCIVISVIAFLCVYLSLIGQNLFPRDLSFSLHAVTAAGQEPGIKKGSALLIDRRYYPRVGEIAAFYTAGSDKIKFGTVVMSNANQFMLQTERDGELLEVGYEFVDGYVYAVVPHLGTVWAFLHDYQIYVWGVFGVAAAALITVGATGKARYRKKRAQALCEIFEFYGAKYDLEDAGLEY